MTHAAWPLQTLKKYMNNNEHIPFLMLLASGFGTLAHSWCEQCHEPEYQVFPRQEPSGSRLPDGRHLKASTQTPNLSIRHRTGVRFLGI